MSNQASIGNFYVDKDGIEQPIVFHARDLVNKCAPIGYHWEQALKWHQFQGSFDAKYTYTPGPRVQLVYEDHYICVKDKETE